MFCESCGIEAPTKYVSLYQNIGALVVRFSKTVEGKLCKRCIHKHFWSLTSTTFFLGWWGTISLFVTPIFLINNLIRYTGCLGMAPVPPDVQPPTLTDETIQRIMPYAQELFDDLNSGKDLEAAAREIAILSEATPAEVILFVRAVIASQQQGALTHRNLKVYVRLHPESDHENHRAFGAVPPVLGNVHAVVSRG